jgi:hypothetical protein
MSEKSPLRGAYDAAERLAAPPLSAIASSADTYHALGVVGKLGRFVGRRVEGVTSGVWHIVGLPSRGDMRRLRTQIGQLDREVRRLTVQLELEREGSARRGGFDERD